MRQQALKNTHQRTASMAQIVTQDSHEDLTGRFLITILLFKMSNKSLIVSVGSLRVTMLIVGSRGDVQPFMALALALVESL